MAEEQVKIARIYVQIYLHEGHVNILLKYFRCVAIEQIELHEGHINILLEYFRYVAIEQIEL